VGADFVWGYVALWVIVFGATGALIGPNKGVNRATGYAVGGVFGPLGIGYLLMRPDARRDMAAVVRAWMLDMPMAAVAFGGIFVVVGAILWIVRSGILPVDRVLTDAAIVMGCGAVLIAVGITEVTNQEPRRTARTLAALAAVIALILSAFAALDAVVTWTPAPGAPEGVTGIDPFIAVFGSIVALGGAVIRTETPALVFRSTSTKVDAAIVIGSLVAMLAVVAIGIATRGP
jgi:hypothetical protein